MNKRIKKVIKAVLSAISVSVIATLFSGCASTFSSCSMTKAEIIERDSFKDGYFKYYYNKNTEHYLIVGDGDEPYPEKLAIPSHYNGKEIGAIYVEAGSGIMATKLFGPTLKGVQTVWFPYNDSSGVGAAFVQEMEYAGIEFGKPQTYFFVCNTLNGAWPTTVAGSLNFGASYKETVYYSPYLYNDRKDTNEGNQVKYKEINGYTIILEKSKKTYQIANTAYMFNYEEAPNEGYFFINDFERGGLIEDTPYEPVRKGYTFGGWYKESECVNKWNFEEDKLPVGNYDEEGYLTNFIETKLYAKWIKN